MDVPGWSVRSGEDAERMVSSGVTGGVRSLTNRMNLGHVVSYQRFDSGEKNGFGRENVQYHHGGPLTKDLQIGDQDPESLYTMDPPSSRVEYAFIDGVGDPRIHNAAGKLCVTEET